MDKVSARQARAKFSDLLKEAERGGTVAITRRGRVVAHLVPPERQSDKAFPDLSGLRESIQRSSAAPKAADLLRQMRDEERY
ncbi:MAG: type II toxin-antitoxin system Phd/YefM family antitoxin [Phycisphaerae bacterium]